MPCPDEIRPLLHELLYVIERTQRVYRSTFVHAPPPDRGDGFARLIDLADRTAHQTRTVLDADSAARSPAYEFRPFGPFLGPTLAQRMRARRMASPPPMPPPSSPRPGRSLH